MYLRKVVIAALLATANMKHVESKCTITMQDDYNADTNTDTNGSPSRNVDVDVTDFSDDCDDFSIATAGRMLDFKVTKSKKKNIDVTGDVVDESSPIIEKTFLTGEDANGNFVSIVQRNDGKMVGSMVDVENSEIVQITYDDDGKMHALVKSVDEFPPEAHAEVEAGESIPQRLLETITHDINFVPTNFNSTISRNTAESENTIIDVLVAWTKKAECFQSGKSANCSVNDKTKEKMEDLIDLAVLETNQAYEESGVSITLELAHAYRSSITEASSDAFSKALSGIRNDKEAKSLREEYKADVVALIIQDSQYCGLGYIGPRIDLMFSVTARSCATGYYSFGHEIGHNMGLEHDRGTKNACNSKNSNYGWRDPSGNFRTIMGYNCRKNQCDNIKKDGCTRIPRFSTPRLSVNGRPLGSTGKADNASHLNANRNIVANYFKNDSRAVTRSPTNAPTQSPTASPTSSPTTAPSNAPTSLPSSTPTVSPTATPTSSPQASPTSRPTATPTSSPTSIPTSSTPTSLPSFVPTLTPSSSSAPSSSLQPSSSPISAEELQKRCSSERWKRYTRNNAKTPKCNALQKKLKEKCSDSIWNKACKRFKRKRCLEDGDASDICPYTCSLQCL